jgi:hypothetical protein
MQVVYRRLPQGINFAVLDKMLCINDTLHPEKKAEVLAVFKEATPIEVPCRSLYKSVGGTP